MRFSREKTEILKGIAILIVIVGHYFRYTNLNNNLKIVGHIGFFGAALFAFVSGYGIMSSYEAKGIYSHWYVKKIVKVYIPFLIVTLAYNIILKKFIFNDYREYIGILYGLHDGTMWFIPWIMCFYLIFWILYSMKIADHSKLILFVSLVIVLTVILESRFPHESVWYTCNFSVLTGALLRKMKFKKKYLIILFSFFLFTVFLLLSLKFRSNLIIKNYSTLFSGSFFCLALCSIPLTDNINYLLKPVGKYSFFIYLTEKKVLGFFNYGSWLYLFPYIFVSLMVAVVLQKSYEPLKTYMISKII